MVTLSTLVSVLATPNGFTDVRPQTKEGVDIPADCEILKQMPKYLDRVFHALADSTRRAMVERLSRGPASVSQLAEPFAMSLPAVVQHLGVLEDAGIVTSQKVGRVRTVQLAPDALVPAGTWIGRQRLPAERRLDRLGEYLATDDSNNHHPKENRDDADS